jgi:hypothetical protein
MKKILVVAVAFVAALSLAIPAHAAGVVRAVNATAFLPVFPGAGNVGSLSGTVAAVGGAPSGALALGTGGVQYNETTCEEGRASGNITIGGGPNLALTWIRLGSTAVLTLSGGGQTGAAAAVFIPNTANFQSDCVNGSPGPMTATIDAVGVAAP